MPKDYVYELTFLIDKNLSDKEREEVLKWVESKIAEIGNFEKKELPKEIALAYAIKKQERAFLATIEFKADKSKIENFKKTLQEKKEILRYLLFKKPKRKEQVLQQIKKPKTLPQAKESLEKESVKEKDKKVELEKIEEKLEEVLKE